VRTTSILTDSAESADTAAAKAAIAVAPAPFSQVLVTITQQEHIELKLAAKQWQGWHPRVRQLKT